MKAVILAAGYGTRLAEEYKEALHTPKGLIKIYKNKTTVDYIIGNITEFLDPEDIFIVTNQKFYRKFLEWGKRSGKNIKIINDGSTENENRLGAIADIFLIIKEQNIQDDILVLASDNLYDYKLINLHNDFISNRRNIVAVKEIKKELISKYGVVTMDNDGVVTSFEEKPKNPKSNTGALANYIFLKEDLHHIEEYLKLNKNADAPGYFLEWLHKLKKIHIHRIKTEAFDIGSLKSLREARNYFKKNKP